jgi:hypothetical protein
MGHVQPPKLDIGGFFYTGGKLSWCEVEPAMDRRINRESDANALAVVS